LLHLPAGVCLSGLARKAADAGQATNKASFQVEYQIKFYTKLYTSLMLSF